MSIVKLPTVPIYWQDECFGVGQAFAKQQMSKKKIFRDSKMFQFSTSDDREDRFIFQIEKDQTTAHSENLRIDIIYDEFNMIMNDLQCPDQRLSLDEAMCGFKGKHSINHIYQQSQINIVSNTI